MTTARSTRTIRCLTRLLLILASLLAVTTANKHFSANNVAISTSLHRERIPLQALQCRGGSNDSGLASYIKSTIQGSIRAIFAIFDTSESNIFSRIYNAFMGADNNDETETDDDEPTNDLDILAPSLPPIDMGNHLAATYNIKATRTELSEYPRIMGDTIQQAIQQAKANAQLLLVYIPTKDKTSNQQAATSLLSKQVAQAVYKKSSKSTTTTTTTKQQTFAIWTAKSGSTNAANAVKLLKNLQNSNSNKPILAVLYGTRVLAQHHCNPPPNPETMAAWLQALRKRHASLYKQMQKQLQEMQWYNERQSNYKQSIQSDLDRSKREAIEQAEKQARQEAADKKRAAIAQRRVELLANLPNEPDDDDDYKVIALRFGDGQSGQRKFASDEKLETIFNWIDAVYEIERENIILTTLNGKKRFTWADCCTDEITLTGLAKMTALRVTIKSESNKEAGDKDEDGG